MENLIKSFAISVLMSGSFVTNGMDFKERERQPYTSAPTQAHPNLERERQPYSATPTQSTQDTTNKPQTPEVKREPQPYSFTPSEKTRNKPQAQNKPQNTQYSPNKPQPQATPNKPHSQTQSKPQYTQNFYQHDSIIITTQQKSRLFAYDQENRSKIEFFLKIRDYLFFGGLPENIDEQTNTKANVHVLDQYVFLNGNTVNTDAVLAIGRLYQIDNPTLKLPEVGTQMTQFLESNQNKVSIFKNFHYNTQAVSHQEIIEILGKHFAKMDTEILNLCPAAEEIWSRAWTLSTNIYDKEKDVRALQMIYDAVVEGSKTRGGCIQGRINRGFVVYVSLLCLAGVNFYK